MIAPRGYMHGAARNTMTCSMRDLQTHWFFRVTVWSWGSSSARYNSAAVSIHCESLQSWTQCSG